MLTFITLCAIVFGGILYTQTGHQLGRLSLKAWKEEDNETTTSFLLFPVSHLNGKVGGNASSSPVTWSEDVYKVLMTIGWPVKLVINLMSLLTVVGPTKVARSFRVIEDYEKRLQAARSEKKRLVARTGTADVKLAMLKALREELDDEIIDAEAELQVERDSKLAELKEAREAHDLEIARMEALAEADAWCRGELPEASRAKCLPPGTDDEDDPTAGAETDAAVEIVLRERVEIDAPLPTVLARVAEDADAEDDHDEEVPRSGRRARSRGASAGSAHVPAMAALAAKA